MIDTNTRNEQREGSVSCQSMPATLSPSLVRAKARLELLNGWNPETSHSSPSLLALSTHAPDSTGPEKARGVKRTFSIPKFNTDNSPEHKSSSQPTPQAAPAPLARHRNMKLSSSADNLPHASQVQRRRIHSPTKPLRQSPAFLSPERRELSTQPGPSAVIAPGYYTPALGKESGAIGASIPAPYKRSPAFLGPGRNRMEERGPHFVIEVPEGTHEGAASCIRASHHLVPTAASKARIAQNCSKNYAPSIYAQKELPPQRGMQLDENEISPASFEADVAGTLAHRLATECNVPASDHLLSMLRKSSRTADWFPPEEWQPQGMAQARRGRGSWQDQEAQTQEVASSSLSLKTEAYQRSRSPPSR
jgi:hypothetical protein